MRLLHDQVASVEQASKRGGNSPLLLGAAAAAAAAAARGPVLTYQRTIETAADWELHGPLTIPPSPLSLTLSLCVAPYIEETSARGKGQTVGTVQSLSIG